LTESIVSTKLILLPTANGLFPFGVEDGKGEDDLVEAAEPACRFGGAMLRIRRSIRHDPIASAVYRQNIGTIEVNDNRRETGAKETKALPMKE
jgi:hypothetical protein